jgi:hypothetical protein
MLRLFDDFSLINIVTGVIGWHNYHIIWLISLILDVKEASLCLGLMLEGHMGQLEVLRPKFWGMKIHKV